jgi:membrane associated rhomboid family serine protease
VRTKLAPGAIVWACPSCAGRAIALAVVRRQVPAGVARELWERARAPGTRPIDATPCPACMRVMARAPLVLGDDDPLAVDVCAPCHLVWFDPGEAEALPPPAPTAAGAAATDLGDADLGDGETVERRSVRRRHGRRPPMFADFLPANRVKSDSLGPWLVAILLAANGLIGLCSDTWFEAWACWFDDWRGSGWYPRGRYFTEVFDFAASLLMHANVWHLLVNVAFLLAYGRFAVQRDGEGPWLGVVLGGALAAGLVHWLATLLAGGPGGPFVGVSAGVAALVVWSALSAPLARVGLPYRSAGRWREATCTALGGALAWIAVQMVQLDSGMAPTPGVAAVGLLTGAVVGGAVALVRPCG